MLAVDPGFKPDGVMTSSLTLSRARYRDNAGMLTFVNEALERFRSLPGVEAAGATSNMPLSGNNNNSVIFGGRLPDEPRRVGGGAGAGQHHARILRSHGRAPRVGAILRPARPRADVTGGDRVRHSQPKVVIVDDRLARRFWPGQDPVGRPHVMPTDTNNLTAITDRTIMIEVVGVVRELKLQSLTQADQAVGAAYFPFAQNMPPPQGQGILHNASPSGPAVIPSALAGPVRSAIMTVDREVAPV